MSRRGILYVIAGPSGSGKGTLVKKLMQRVPNLFYSVSATTRLKRPNEKEGIDYYFISEKEFGDFVETEQFLEWAPLYGYRYGTLKKTVLNKLEAGVDVILEIDVQGARQVKQNLDEKAVFIFILPPDISELERRLTLRNTETEADLRKRLDIAADEMRAADEFDYKIINKDIEAAVDQLVGIINIYRN